MNKPNYNIITPFKRWTIQNFPFIEEDFDAITNYQLLSKIIEYLNKVIENEKLLEQSNNELIDAFNNLKSYIDNYFEELDIQEEINNKLDDMAESGQLTDIIAQYLQLAGVLAYNNISDMSDALNIVEGSICYTLGQTEYNDGKGAFYKIRTITSGDVVDGFNIVALDVSDTLIAERMPNYLNDKIDLLECFNPYYNEITYETGRTNDTNYYIITIPYEDSNNNEIPFNIIKSQTNTSPLQNAWLQNSNVTTNASLAVNNGVTFINGICIIDGVVDNDVDVSAYCTNEQYLGIKNNRVISVYPNNTTATTMLNDGVKYACLIFGQCVENSVIDPDFTFQTGYDCDIYLGQKANKDILIIGCDGRNRVNKGMSYQQMSQILIDKGCINVYALDGGGSTSLNFKGNKINMNIDNNGITDRKITYLFNVNKKPTINRLTDVYNFIGRRIQDYNAQIRPIINSKQLRTSFAKYRTEENFVPTSPDTNTKIPLVLSAPSDPIIAYDNTNKYFTFGSNGIVRFTLTCQIKNTHSSSNKVYLGMFSGQDGTIPEMNFSQDLPVSDSITIITISELYNYEVGEKISPFMDKGTSSTLLKGVLDIEFTPYSDTYFN